MHIYACAKQYATQKRTGDQEEARATMKEARREREREREK